MDEGHADEGGECFSDAARDGMGMAMKALALLVAGLGAVLCAVAFVMLTDRLATPERKAALEEAVADPDALGLDEDQADTLRAAVMVRDTLGGGIFFTAPVDLATLLPPAPLGWSVALYAAADGTEVTGEAVTKDIYGVSPRQEMLRGLSKTTQTALDVARTYRRDDRLIIIWLHGKLDTFRHLKTWEGAALGEILALRQPDPDAPYLARIDGLALRQLGRVEITGGQLSGFRHLQIDLGQVIRAEILTNASDLDLGDVLAGFDAAPLQAVLPRQTEGYDAEAGLVFASGLPLSDVPPMPPARRLAEAARHFDHLDETERALLKQIARGELATAQAARTSPFWAEDMGEPVQTILALLPEG